MERAVLIAVVGAIAFAAAGCGGSKTLSRAELVKQVNAICKQREARTEAVAARAKTLLVAEQRALPIVSKSVDDLGALKPPASVRAKYARFVAYERTMLAKGRRALAGRGVGRETRQDAQLGHARYGLITELGFTACR